MLVFNRGGTSPHSGVQRYPRIYSPTPRSGRRNRLIEIGNFQTAGGLFLLIKPVFALRSYRTKESRIRKYVSPKFDGMLMSDIVVKQIRPSSSSRWCVVWSRPIRPPVCAGCCACRPDEATDAEWDEFDFKDALWRRPAAKMKARRDHVSPLSTQAISFARG